MLYGVDGVHGHNTVTGATVFPHNISLGCANDTKLMEKIGKATATEMKATGILWNFAPFVSIPEVRNKIVKRSSLTYKLRK